MGLVVYNIFEVQKPEFVEACNTGKIRGLTIVEMIIALSLMTIVFASIVPIFSQINQSWNSKQAAAETLQNGRVLMDHIQRNLSRAVKITSVSISSETDGYIEFENRNSEIQRYDINNSNGYVEFGQTGNLFDLAGPVSSLKFTCYDACDLDTPIIDVNSIRFIKIETSLVNSNDTNQNKTLTAGVYLYTNSNLVSDPGIVTQITYDYSNRIQGTNIFAYDGEDNLQVSATSTSPTAILSSNEYDHIEIDDGIFHTYSVTNNSKYGQMRFLIIIDENRKDVTQITALFNGKGTNSKKNDINGVSLYIWNYALLGYELLETSTDTKGEITISGTLTTSLSNYIGGINFDTIVLLAATNSKKPNKENLEIMTDYVKLEITSSSGGGSSIYP